jgi:hypothetical protein
MTTEQDSLIIDNEATLCDIGCMEPVPVHGLLGLVNLGDTFLSCYYRWRPIKMERGLLVRERTLALVIVRPRSSALPGGRFDASLRTQPVVEDAERFISLSLN